MYTTHGAEKSVRFTMSNDKQKDKAPKDASVKKLDREYLRTTIEVLIVIALFLLGTYMYGG